MPSKLVGWHGQHTSDERRQSREEPDAGSVSSSRIKLTHLILEALPALVARVLPVPSYKLWRHSFSEQAKKLSLLHNKSLIIIKVSLFIPKFMSIIIFVESFSSSKIFGREVWCYHQLSYLSQLSHQLSYLSQVTTANRYWKAEVSNGEEIRLWKAWYTTIVKEK